MRDPKSFDPRRLDVAAFARAQGRLDGQCDLAEMPRLASVLASSSGPAVAWQLQGSQREVAGEDRHTLLHLQAQAEVQQTCQRCLEPLEVALQIDRRFRFVGSEDEAERLDEQSEEEDVLAMPVRLAVPELLEDELILALPIVPMHVSCLAAVPLPEDGAPGTSCEATASASPFAALAALRKPPRAD